MRIGVSLQDPRGPGPMTALREELRRAADQGFASAWMSNIFGVDALTALAVAGNQVPGIEVGTAVVPPLPAAPGRAGAAGADRGGGRRWPPGARHRAVPQDRYRGHVRL